MLKHLKRHSYKTHYQTIIIKRNKSISFSLPAEKQIDLDAVDLKKLKVRDLKKILNDWGEECKACTEKSDFIKRIEHLKPKHFKKAEL